MLKILYPGDDFAAQQLYLFQNLLLRHARPLHPADHVVNAQFIGVASKFRDYIVGRAKQEPVFGQVLVGHAETLFPGDRKSVV